MDLAALYMEVVPKAMREYRKEMRKSRASHLTVPQFRILAQLRTESSTNHSLAEFQGVSIAAMSRMVNVLCRYGMVERLRDENDRRLVHVCLTPQGRRSFESFREQARVRLQQRLKSLNLDEQQSLTKGLAALASVIDQMGQSAEV